YSRDMVMYTRQMRTTFGLRHVLKISFLLVTALYLRVDSPALHVEGATGRDGVARPPLSLSFADLANMPHVTARVNARDGTERTYEGVLLWEVLKRAGQP